MHCSLQRLRSLRHDLTGSLPLPPIHVLFYSSPSTTSRTRPSLFCSLKNLEPLALALAALGLSQSRQRCSASLVASSQPFSPSTMEDVETEQRISRKRRKLTTRQGVVIGVATVAGLGLVSKLVSFLRREKPKKVEDSDIHSLEAVVSGDAAKGVLATPQFANLEEDDAPDADSSTPERDATQGLDANSTPASHFNGEENGVTHPSDNDDAVQLRKEKEGEHHSENGVEPPLGNTEHEAHTKEVEELPIEDAGKLPTEDVERLSTAEVQKLPTEDVEESHVEHLPTGNEEKLDSEDDGNFQVENAEELPIEQGTHAVEAHREKQANGDVEKLATDDKVKPFIEEAADAADRLDTEDASEPEVKDTERLEIAGDGKHESKPSVEALRVDAGKDLTQNGEILQS